MRLAAQAKMGYYPTPPSVISLIADILIRNGKGNIKSLDPCAGEGRLSWIQSGEGLPKKILINA